MPKKDNFTVEDVKRLREKTGKGLFTCVKALREHDGDEEKAIEYLKNYNDIIMY